MSRPDSAFRTVATSLSSIMGGFLPVRKGSTICANCGQEVYAHAGLEGACPGNEEASLTACLRVVTVDEDDGTRTRWVLVGHQDAKDERGRWYTRLLLVRGAESRSDITLEPLVFNQYMNDREAWPLCEFALEAEDVEGPLWPTGGAGSNGG